MIEALLNTFQESYNAFISTQTLFATGVGFLALSWAFPQIIFPKLKKLDDIQDEIVEFGQDNYNLGEKIEEDSSATGQDQADKLNRLFQRYETIFSSGMNLVDKVSSIYIVLTAVAVFMVSGNIYVALVYTLIVGIIVRSIVKSYPDINKIRSLSYLVHETGFNPWTIWILMKPGMHFSSSGRDWALNSNDDVEVTLSQRVFITGWRYYLQVSDNSNSKVWLITSSSVSINNTDKSFIEYGADYYLTIGKFNHSNLTVPLRNGLREFKAGLLIFVPVFKTDTFNPFQLKDYAEIQKDTRSFSSSVTELNSNNLRMSMTDGIEVQGVGDKFRIEFDKKRKTLDVVNWDIAKELKFAHETNISINIMSKDGELSKTVKSKQLKLLRLFYIIFKFMKLPKMRIGYFDKAYKP